jgi:hypothetical protein
MKAKVLRKFRDKYTKEIYETGQIIDITHERYEEINSTAHGVLVQSVEKRINLEDMTKKEIIEYAKSKGVELNTRMTKAEMIKELM